MNPRFAKFKGKSGQWYWTYIAVNGEPVGDGSEGYANESDCDNGIRLMKECANAPVVTEEPPAAPAKKAKAKRK